MTRPDLPPGAKERDYFWTVVVTDPLAVPLVRLLVRRRWLTPNQTTWVSFVLGAAVGPAFAYWGRSGLVLGALLFYLSFVFDCVDGKLARALQMTSSKGKTLDAIADGARRASASAGVIAYLWQSAAAEWAIWVAIGFSLAAFYFMQISGGERVEVEGGLRGRWARALARRRLLPNPGMPDVSGIVFVIGPLIGAIVPALVVGSALLAVGILRVLWRAAR